MSYTSGMQAFVWLVIALFLPLKSLSAGSTIRTWWHSQSVQTKGPISLWQVRSSSEYEVFVRPTNPSDSKGQPSFVYKSIPRNGEQQLPYGDQDGAEFAVSTNLSMNWTSFQYSADVFVDIRRQKPISPTSLVSIKPSFLNLSYEQIDSHTVRVRVPYRRMGYRISIEFDDDLYWSYSDPSFHGGLLNTAGVGARIHQEPRNALLIFAEDLDSFPAADDVAKNSETYFPLPGLIEPELWQGYRKIVFRTGVYYLAPQSHAFLPPSVTELYLEGGAYVKGSFEFQGREQSYSVSGLGVISGEIYPYEADRKNQYQRSNQGQCHGDCIKLLQFFSSKKPQQLRLEGITLANPPYHSFVVYGDSTSFAMTVSRFKQVGAWYWQTDGLELLDGSSMRHSFFHSNDDVIKLYHSNLRISDIVVWKAENGPVIQMGWVPRAIRNIKVNGIYVIHNRMYWNDQKHNHCLINSARHYLDSGSDNLADSSKTISDVTIDGVIAEGLQLCALRLYLLGNLESLTIKNLFVDAWNDLLYTSQLSLLMPMTNPEGETVRIGSPMQPIGLQLRNYWVAGQRVSLERDNWRYFQIGRLAFQTELSPYWYLD
ncbi:family 49 glycosyl hydrolase [Pseudobacteriovorax antillogorgiicola]|uniref:Glycosyl hydrolase family 49 n=1 Tax=Pseudobacteriovorax antillogorgiicola TaxID=1513793 RepID=A0A1Y6C8Z5_9BACT|nr:family 49 glycosyl hydrolase [Pseudobacteriovorax antillogorgiicola]TCS49837.1 glycosyl hydrolase family 49 [Pseudobacteriovorax antillogorgiicola]SMF43441.1 Glycosyl hydrolase family 49 [Pseudobacteriovorax antillogorgiicola]